MAKTYTSTVEVRCWKEHTCSCCGAAYSYLLVRNVKDKPAAPRPPRRRCPETVGTVQKRSLSLVLAPPGAGARYTSLWWTGSIGAIALVLTCSIVLLNIATAYQRNAQPTRIYT